MFACKGAPKFLLQKKCAFKKDALRIFLLTFRKLRTRTGLRRLKNGFVRAFRSLRRLWIRADRL